MTPDNIRQEIIRLNKAYPCLTLVPCDPRAAAYTKFAVDKAFDMVKSAEAEEALEAAATASGPHKEAEQA
jgi:hypothetical protein